MNRMFLVGAAVAAVLGLGIYKLTTSDVPAPDPVAPTAATTPASAPDRPVAREPGETMNSAPAPVEREAGSAEPTATTESPGTEAPSATAALDPTHAGSAVPHAKRSRDEIAKSLREPQQPGEPPTFKGEAGAAHRKRLLKVVQKAACHAPDLEARYEQMPAEQAAELRATCATYGVTLRAPKQP